MSHQSVLLRPWPGPFGGVPPWDQVDPREFLAAFERAIEDAEEEVQAIAKSPEPACFDNTILTLERAGQTLERLKAVFWVHAGSLNLDPIPELQQQIMPMLAAHDDAIIQNNALFRRIQLVFEGEELCQLSSSQQRLVEDRYRQFVRHGAQLEDKQKAELAAINQHLAKRFTLFSQNVLADEQEQLTWIRSESDLAGLPTYLIDAMAQAAREHGAQDELGGPQHAVDGRSFLDLCRPSRDTPACLGTVHPPR